MIVHVETYLEYKKTLGGNEMIHKVGQIMLYVNNQDEGSQFLDGKGRVSCSCRGR